MQTIQQAQATANMLHTNIYEGLNANDEVIFRVNCQTIKQAAAKLKFQYGDAAIFIQLKQVDVVKITQDDLNHEAQELIFQVLEHLSAGRTDIDLMKQKLIQAAKNLPCRLHSGLSKYN
jgi:hypothetical protein